MKQDILTKLPSEIIISILLRLPVRSIISCKCVCKSLLESVESREFGLSYLSESTPFLAVLEEFSGLCRIYEIKDLLNLENHEFHYHLLSDFSLLHWGCIRGSANGLLLLVDTQTQYHAGPYICSPFTRDYVKLHYSLELAPKTCMVTYGFGASKMTGQYKVVRIFKCNQQCDLQSNAGFECQVYTLGTRSWRKIDPGPTWGRIQYLIFNYPHSGAFLNGNLHWLLFNPHGALVIYCFDLETELFSTLSLPIRSTSFPRKRRFRLGLSTLRDCLCICDDSCDDKIVIWLMKEYGVEKSWTVEYVICPSLQDGVPISNFQDGFQDFRPIKVMRDGDILMAAIARFVFFYSDKTKTVRRLDFFGSDSRWTTDSILLTPRFISLKNFAAEDVRSFDDPF